MTANEFDISERFMGHEGTELRLAGRLTAFSAGRLRDELRRRVKMPSVVRIDLSGVETLDGSAAAVLADLWVVAMAGGSAIHFTGADGPVRNMLELYTERAPRQCLRPVPKHQSALEQIGRTTMQLAGTLREVLDFLGQSLDAALKSLRDLRTVNWRDVGRVAERTGADGLPIVLLISFLIGLSTAFQAAGQLHKFGADVFLSDLVGLSVVRELGPLMTAIVVAGRSGASIAAEVGTMKVSEEIDALRTLGLCPHRFLVFPRVLGLTLMLPLLTLLADFVGVLGGLLIGVFQLELSMNGYIAATRDTLDGWDVFGGLLKSVAFGIVIALIACERGLATRGGAEGVGRSTTTAVVAILFHVILVDTIFTVLYQRFGV